LVHAPQTHSGSMEKSYQWHSTDNDAQLHLARASRQSHNHMRVYLERHHVNFMSVSPSRFAAEGSIPLFVTPNKLRKLSFDYLCMPRVCSEYEIITKLEKNEATERTKNNANEGKTKAWSTVPCLWQKNGQTVLFMIQNEYTIIC